LLHVLVFFLLARLNTMVNKPKVDAFLQRGPFDDLIWSSSRRGRACGVSIVDSFLEFEKDVRRNCIFFCFQIWILQGNPTCNIDHTKSSHTKQRGKISRWELAFFQIFIHFQYIFYFMQFNNWIYRRCAKKFPINPATGCLTAISLFYEKAPNQRDSGNIEYFEFEITRTRLSNVFFFFDRFHRKITVRVNLDAYHFHETAITYTYDGCI
jgi:hypothetical protein